MNGVQSFFLLHLIKFLLICYHWCRPPNLNRLKKFRNVSKMSLRKNFFRKRKVFLSLSLSCLQCFLEYNLRPVFACAKTWNMPEPDNNSDALTYIVSHTVCDSRDLILSMTFTAWPSSGTEEWENIGKTHGSSELTWISQKWENIFLVHTRSFPISPKLRVNSPTL